MRFRSFRRLYNLRTRPQGRSLRHPPVQYALREPARLDSRILDEHEHRIAENYRVPVSKSAGLVYLLGVDICSRLRARVCHAPAVLMLKARRESARRYYIRGRYRTPCCARPTLRSRTAAGGRRSPR